MFSVVKKNATQSTVMRVNNKRKHAHQMRALSYTFFDTRLRENGACVLRVHRPLISDLYCSWKLTFRIKMLTIHYGMSESDLFLHVCVLYSWEKTLSIISCNMQTMFKGSGMGCDWRFEKIWHSVTWLFPSKVGSGVSLMFSAGGLLVFIGGRSSLKRTSFIRKTFLSIKKTGRQNHPHSQSI